jgi:hypothetical protein
MTDDTLLSKWWRTPSAQAAAERAKQSRRERLNKVREDFAAREREGRGTGTVERERGN